MNRILLVAGAVAIAVLATSALAGNAGVQTGQRAQVVSLQAQVTELRRELICLDAVSGDAYEQNWFSAESANGTPKPQKPINDHAICRGLGIKTQIDTTTSSVYPTPFTQLVGRAFGH
ncbi:MAG: hypothetical protein JOY72_07025 [Actinobacteria bacterium]|nr:hypothetical protein [Actinomycetota bacterium]MBV8480041.1 hypothetical protein [Actinomycetota bacterium]